MYNLYRIKKTMQVRSTSVGPGIKLRVLLRGCVDYTETLFPAGASTCSCGEFPCIR